MNPTAHTNAQNQQNLLWQFQDWWMFFRVADFCFMFSLMSSIFNIISENFTIQSHSFVNCDSGDKPCLMSHQRGIIFPQNYLAEMISLRQIKTRHYSPVSLSMRKGSLKNTRICVLWYEWKLQKTSQKGLPYKRKYLSWRLFYWPMICFWFERRVQQRELQSFKTLTAL